MAKKSSGTAKNQIHESGGKALEAAQAKKAGNNFQWHFGRITSLGSSMGVSEFRELVSACLETMCNGQSIYQVICHPREALALCEYIRSKSKAASLPHSLILQVLLTFRKK